MSNIHIEYIPLWEFQVSPRSTLVISRMLYPAKEKEFHANDKYLKTLESYKEYEVESRKRHQIKKDEEKFKINSLNTGFSGQQYRTNGASIYRRQIPSLIAALQDIHDGKHDSAIMDILHQSGLVEKD